MTSYDYFLIVLGIVAAICLSPIGHGLGIIALISAIGIPIAFLIAAIPPVFIILLLGRLFMLVLPFGGLAAIVTGVVPSLVLLSGVSIYANWKLDSTARSLVADDFGLSARASRPVNLALVQGFSSQNCNEFCQYVLLNGVAQSVTVAAWPKHGEALGQSIDGLKGTRFRLVSAGGKCPGENQVYGAARMRMAAGKCFISTPATIAGADVVITSGNIRSGKNEYDAALDVFADTVSATRTSYYERHLSVLVEKSRRTSIDYWPLRRPLLLSWVLGSESDFRARVGFLRSRSVGRTSLEGLIAELGYDLPVRQTNVSK